MEEFYITNAECVILQKDAGELVDRVHNDSIIIDLGHQYEIFIKKSTFCKCNFMFKIHNLLM